MVQGLHRLRWYKYEVEAAMMASEVVFALLLPVAILRP